jgi:hypothetical protein
MAGIELGLLLDFILDTVPKRLADRTAVTALSIICNALRIIAKRYFRGHVDFSRVRAEHILWRLLIDMDCEGVTMVKEGTKILMSKQKHDLRQLLLEKVICGVLVLMPEVRGIPTPAMIVDAQAKGFRDIVM